MSVLDRLFRPEVGKAAESGRRRALTRVGAVGGVLAFMLVWVIASRTVSYAAFPGANGKIAFHSNRDGNHSQEIYVMNADGTNPTRLTTNPGSGNEYPAWSPDGSKIVFDSWRDGNAEIYVMNADGTGQTRLTNNSVYDACPAWSPDGTKITWVANHGFPNIYVMNADGTGQTNLTNFSAFENCPAWSPDGTKIAFARGPDIYVMNGDGTGQTLLITGLGAEDYPNWSPDGSRIAFSNGSAIYVANADGSGPTQLTTSGGSINAPAWSPDGTKIAFYDNGEVYVMNHDGTGQAPLTNSPAGTVSGAPDWQPRKPTHPFASFTARVEIDRAHVLAIHGGDSFEVEGRGTLGPTSDGIAPNTEAVTLSVGALSLTIPAGSFVKRTDGDEDHDRADRDRDDGDRKRDRDDSDDRITTYRFKGVIAGVSLRAEIEQGPNHTFRFHFEGRQASFGLVVNPVTVALAIGDDVGQAVVKADIDK